MAINAILATLAVAPNKVNCPPAGGKFTVTVTVTTAAVGAGGVYDVSIYADQGWWPDTLLDIQAGNKVGAGRIKKVYTFTLHCDKKCKIAGAKASSGNNPCDIYAYAVDNVGGAKSQSGKQTLECVHDDDEEPRSEDSPPPKRKLKGKRKISRPSRKARAS